MMVRLEVDEIPWRLHKVIRNVAVLLAIFHFLLVVCLIMIFLGQLKIYSSNFVYIQAMWSP